MGFASYKANNLIESSRTLFNERGKYNNRGIPDRYIEKYPGLFRNFWFIENMYYGRINRNHQFVIPKEDKVRQVSGTSIYLFDFAAHALEDFLGQHDKALRTSKIQKNDEYLSELTPRKGYRGILKDYDVYMNAVRKDIHKKAVRNASKIENFDDFVKFFLNEIYNGDQITPVTLTGFVSSRNSSPLNTGLFCDITNISYDNDFDKIELIVRRPNYEFFINNALRNGFMIDYNIPTRLCANLGSGEMEKYMSLYNVNSENIFSNYYDRINQVDHIYFMEYLKKFYNKFVSVRRNIKREETLDKKKNIIRRYNDKRSSLTAYELENKYGGSYRVQLYIDIRNYETGYRYDKSSIDLINSVAQDYLQNSSLQKALDYIDYQFIGFLNDSGAFNAYTLYGEAVKSQEEISGQQLQDRLNASVRGSRKTFY